MPRRAACSAALWAANAVPLREPLNSIKNCQIVLINGDRNEEFEEKIKEISNKIISSVEEKASAKLRS